MAKASDNVFPSLLLAEGSAPASPSSGQHRLFVDTADDKLKRKDSAGTVTTVEGGGSGSGIIARTSYDPVSLASYTTTSTSDGDVDATNLAVTFTVPASGSVLVTLEGVGGLSGTQNDNAYWGLRSGSSTVGALTIAVGGTAASGGTGNGVYSKSFLVTGLTPGASLTYKWAWKSNTGSNTCRLFAGGAAGAAHMVVRSG